MIPLRLNKSLKLLSGEPMVLVAFSDNTKKQTDDGRTESVELETHRVVLVVNSCLTIRY